MPTLIRDIILPERIRTEAQSGGVADRMRARLAPLVAEFMEVQTEIDEVTSFAHGLWERHVLDDEMPTKVIDVSRVNYFAGQILNGGFLQFVQNSR